MVAHHQGSQNHGGMKRFGCAEWGATDVRYWPKAADLGCPLFRCLWGPSGLSDCRMIARPN
jgi:hypothetical protein